jgi:hypothetical protein
MTMASFSFQLSKNNQRFPRFVVYTPLSLRIAVGGGLMRHGSPTLKCGLLISHNIKICRALSINCLVHSMANHPVENGKKVICLSVRLQPKIFHNGRYAILSNLTL